MTRSLVAASCLVVLVGCGPDSGAFVAGDEAQGDELDFAVGELNADAIVAFVNASTTTLEVLANDVKLDARAAKGLVDGRPFASLAQVDAVPYVGAVALAKLDAFAAAAAPTAEVSVEGVVFTADEARDAVAIANDARLLSAGLSTTATNQLVAGRPYATVTAIGAVSGVGPAALTALRTFARAHPGSAPTPTPSGCSGGTYDGVPFTASEECHAVDFMNRARFSELGALTDAARLVVYELGPDGTFNAAPRGTTWKSVAQFAARPGIGATAVKGLKTGAATWSFSGSSVDTVADAWAHRSTLVGAPLYLDVAYVTKLLPQQGDGGFLWECAEVRDAPTASNFLLACRPAVVCGGFCWADVALGAKVTRLHGTFKRSVIPGSGGYRMTVN